MRRFASLRRQGDFTRLRQRGRRTASANLTFYRADAAPADERPLVGITVSKSVGTAVARNLLRRRLAAIIHELLPDHARMRLLVVPRPSAAAISFPQLRDEVRRVLV
ncbi:MAG TPA: ribonuclease P protein component [Candidatus Baltobacteraceae bacterium]|jgi:ribonuclease P protein component|nr:ribonuclease P protein component [Candidatus Baltobacteraceae bacterium]